MLWFWRKRHPFTFDQPPSKQRFATIRGRRIAVDIPYLLPKDDEEIGRLDFQHYMLKYALQGLYAAPIKQPRTILDVATGTGRWAMEMAAQFPRAVVTGFDIVAPPADDAQASAFNPGKRAANYVFQTGNMFDGLPFPDNSFDFVHMRLVYAATPTDRWSALVREVMRVTRPGGYVELVEGYVLIDTGPATNAIQSAIIEASQRKGIGPTFAKNLPPLLKHIGMRDVKWRSVYLPLGKEYGGRLGEMTERDVLSVFKGIGAQVVNAAIMSAEDWNQLYGLMADEFVSNRTVWPVFQVYGRKPEK